MDRACRNLWIELRDPGILHMIQYNWRRHIDRLIIFTNLKFNYFTHLNEPLQSTEQNHRPSTSIAQCGCLRDLQICRFFATTLPLSYFSELILLDRLHYMIGDLFPKYQSGAKRRCLVIVILRQLQGVMACSIAGLLFRRRRSVILFRGV